MILERVPSLKEDIAIFGGVMILSAIVNNLGLINRNTIVFTELIFALEGSAVLIFQSVVNPILTNFMVAVYLFLYPLLLLGAYYYLKQKDLHINYAKSYAFLIIISAGFFYFVPVKVSGHYIPGLEPILYNFNPLTVDFFTSLGDFHAAFPSLHTGLAAVAAIHLHNEGKLISIVGWVATFLIMISTFYLGIHWLTDAAFGLGLAYLSCRFIESSYMKSFEQRTMNLLEFRPFYLRTRFSSR
ncbi:MAG: phosphatase PAP2 family protein [Candidatus Nanohaloarchaea archaeon]